MLECKKQAEPKQKEAEVSFHLQLGAVNDSDRIRMKIEVVHNYVIQY